LAGGPKVYESLEAVLVKVLEIHGPSALDNPRLIEATMRDLCNAHPREINILMAAANAGVPRRLSELAGQGLYPSNFVSLVTQLENDMGLTENAARWAVRSWAAALQLDGGTPLSQHETLPPKHTASQASLGQKPLQAAMALVGEADFLTKEEILRATELISETASHYKEDHEFPRESNIVQVLLSLLRSVDQYLLRRTTKIANCSYPVSSHIFSDELARWQKRKTWHQVWVTAYVERIQQIVTNFEKLYEIYMSRS
jgi:hypothetical protein